MTKKEKKQVIDGFKADIALAVSYYDKGKFDYAYLVRSTLWKNLPSNCDVVREADMIEENILKGYGISVNDFRDTMYDFMNKGGVD